MNRSKRVTSLLILAAMVSVGATGAVQAGAQTRFSSPAGYSFTAPAKWQRDDADISMGRVRYALVTPDTHVVASLAISTIKGDGTDLNTLADKVRQDAKDNGDKMTIVSDKSVSVGGVPGVVIETKNARPEEPDTEMTFLSVRNGVGCKIVLKCKSAVAAKYAPAFNKAVSTFRWK